MAPAIRQAARLVAGGAALLAGAVFADSAIEHYRGSFDNRVMPVPVVVSALSLLANGGLAVGRAPPLAMRVQAASAAIGTAGLGFHAWNITKQVGGVRWGTLFYQAPIGAPGALVLAGGLGAAAEALAQGRASLGPVPLLSGRALAGACAFGIAGTAAEAALLHFRGAYHNPAMWLPVTLTPLAALALARAALTGRVTWITTAALAVTAALGLAGSAFHAYGISRDMGGWRNWRQNLFSGPPLPAPPAYTGLAIAAFGALLLMRGVTMAERFAGYDVLAGRETLSWNAKTRAVIEDRLALQVVDGVLTPTQLATLCMTVHRLCPDPAGRPATTTLAMIVHKIAADAREGYRHHLLPGTAECWQRGLDALEAEARARYGIGFAALTPENADIVLRLVSQGDIRAREWGDLPPKLFWNWRLLPDCVAAHWAQPSLWSAMGFGGPAAPRGYVRTGIDRRDPWEAIEAGEPLKGWPRHRG